MEISIETILSVFRKCAVLMLVIALVAGIGAYFASEYFITPTYSSVAKINVVTSKEATSASEANTGTSYITKILKTCRELLESNTFKQRVKEDIAIDYVPELSFESSDDSTVILIKAFDSNSQTACDIAQVAAENSVDYISDMTSGLATVKIYDKPIPSVKPTSPHPAKNAVITIFAVAILIYFIFFIAEMMGTKVKGERELALRFEDIPIIATIPDFNDSIRNSKRYYYYNKYSSYHSEGYADNSSNRKEENNKNTGVEVVKNGR